MDKLVEPNIQTASAEHGCDICEQNNEDIHFVLHQSDKQQTIDSIVSVDNDVASLCLKTEGFVKGSASVEVDYAQQHFQVAGHILTTSDDMLTFHCEDIACMKVRMFLQLLNIQVFKHCQSRDCDTLESAAKLWVDDQAESFADNIDNINPN